MKLLTGISALFLLFAVFEAGGQPVNTNAFVLLPVNNDPTISFRIWFKTGSQHDPAGKEGLAYITGQMLADASTRTNTYAQIIDRLYPLAAGYGASVSAEMTIISGRVHKDNLAPFFSLFTDAMLLPAFTQEDLDRIKSQTLNYLENTLRYANDEELGKAVLYGEVYKGTPYGHIVEGTVAGVKSITLEDVREFYTRHFTRENVVPGVGGGYDEELVTRLAADLGRLPSGPSQSAPPIPFAPADGFRVTIVEKDAPATAISMGFPLRPVRGERAWYALAIANSWLGEHRNSSSHLYQVIREARGLNYGDYSYIEHFPYGGMRQMPPQNVARRMQMFEIWIRPVPLEAGLFALRAALREFKNLVEQGLTEEQFQQTRNFLKKYVLHYAPTTMERLGYALDDRFYGIEGSHLEKFRAMMDDLSREEVNAAIREYWQFGNMQIAVVTKDGGAFRDALLAGSPSPIS
ncbi:MAG: insulinase family protein, partial [Bacteroidetes bacterium]|nr:insulinase family protein [Bacteroidota bacterium]